MDPNFKALVESLCSKVQDVVDNGDWPTDDNVEELTCAIQDGLAGM